MKKLILLYILLFFPHFFLNALDFSFSLQYEDALYFGKQNEFVYWTPVSKDESQTLSHLEWNFSGLFFKGFKETFSFPHINVQGFYAAGFQSDVGKMYDSDWQNPNDPNQKTNYSINDNHLTQANIIRLNISSPIKISSFFTLSPIAGFSYRELSFLADNGEGWYGDPQSTRLKDYVSYDDENAKHYEKGNLFSVSLSRMQYDFFIGAGLNVKINSILSVNFSPYISVYTAIDSIDFHAPSYYYYDVLNGFFKNAGFFAEIEAFISPSFSLGFAWQFDYTLPLKGITYYKYSKNGSYGLVSASTSGASGFLHSISLYAKITVP